MEVIQRFQSAFSLALLGRAAGGFALLGLVWFSIRLYQVRNHVRKTASQYGIVTHDASFVDFGHLVSVGKVMAKHPRDTSGLNTAIFLAEQYPEVAACGVIIMDVWPIIQPGLTVIDPDLVPQFTQQTSLPKAEFMTPEWYPFTQAKDLLITEGAEWKRWRAIFNPGFSAKNIIALLPGFLEEIQVMKEVMTKVARSGEVVKFETLVRRELLTLFAGPSCEFPKGIRLQSQTQHDPFSTALRAQVHWLINQWDLSAIMKMLNPFRPLMIWKNNRLMRKFLTPLVQRAITDASNQDRLDEPKTVNYLAARAYLAESRITGKEPPQSAAVDPEFVDRAIQHLKMFLFAGHETTASTLSWAFNNLYKHPSTMAALRAEHDAVLGSDPAAAFNLLSADPHLLNQLPYTQAVVKETLRLYPVGGTARAGRKGFLLTHPDTGMVFPTEGFFVFDCNNCYQRSERYFPRAAEFLPERWLAREGDPLHVAARRGGATAFRPFEAGPRTCIGQELVLTEIRAILAMTAREFDVEPAYADDAPEVFGEKAYQIMHITGTVKDEFPARIKLRKV